MTEKKHLRNSFILALFALLIALTAVSTASFAWYIYNTANQTTKLEMAAGAGANLKISNTYNGTYGAATVLDSFTGELTPVSTDNILNGFQKVEEFEHNVAPEGPSVLASTFFNAETYDYYQTSLYLQTNADTMDIYISNIGFENSSSVNPISTAIRMGFVVHEAGEAKPVNAQYIYAIDQSDNPQAEYNTKKGIEGHVLDSTKTDGSTVDFSSQLLTASNYCGYDSSTGEIVLSGSSSKLCTLNGSGGQYGDSVQIDVYIWLEGCDKDCTSNLARTTLRNIAITFAGDRH